MEKIDERGKQFYVQGAQDMKQWT